MKRQAQQLKELTRAARGQGVVEYSGALVIAVVVVGAGIIVVPQNFTNMLNTIIANMTTYLMAQMG